MTRTANDWRRLFGLKRKKTFTEKLGDHKLLMISAAGLALLLGFHKTTLPFLANLLSKQRTA